MNKLKFFWSQLRSSFWFLPAVIVALSIFLALGMIEVDSSGSWDWMARWPRLFGANAEGARGMLTTIAGSMMTVVGVTFSMTLVTLALASSQYTSRILRNFMRDHATQAVLGIFTGIFTYCLLVMRTIRGGGEDGFVPSLSVTFSVVLAIGGIGTLIFFIHHIASSIQASSIIASVTKETLAAVDRLYPENPEREEETDEHDHLPAPPPSGQWHPVMSTRNGYLQGVDDATLLRLSVEHDTVVRMDRGIGDFVVENTPLASLAMENPPGPEVMTSLRAAYSIDRYRTVDQDCAFGIRQLVDMALRALSPGINDTTTALTCVDYLTAILARLAPRDLPATHRYPDGNLRVIVTGQTFARLVAESFEEIRCCSGNNVTILLRMLDALHTVGSLTDRPDRRRVLREQVTGIAEIAGRTLAASRDQIRFENRLEAVREALMPV